eukprot:1146530-Pelagomonas_calceolata.AAC.11
MLPAHARWQRTLNTARAQMQYMRCTRAAAMHTEHCSCSAAKYGLHTQQQCTLIKHSSNAHWSSTAATHTLLMHADQAQQKCTLVKHSSNTHTTHAH